MQLTTVVSLLAAITVTACSTVTPVEAPPEELQRLITAEDLLSPGDRVQLVTSDGTSHEFRVAAIDLDEGFIRGTEEAVPIADVIAVQTREVAVGKTTALAAGLYVGVGVIIAIALGPVLLLGGL